MTGTPSSLKVRPAAPEVLIHLHIAKTGGTSLSSMLKHGFLDDEVFESTKDGDESYSGLGVIPYECSERDLQCKNISRLRYVSGHFTFGLHRAFERPAKYITIARHPVERVLSLYFFRMQSYDPFLKDGRRLGFEEYVESRCDINLNDYQVRVVSGSPELDAAPPPPGGLVAAAPVERRHLEQAKRNIEQLFLAAAPIEQVTEMALMLRRVYGWPMRRIQSEYKNPTAGRPRAPDISPHLIKIIEECNSYDVELYEWIVKRFAQQKAGFEPELSRDRRVYGAVNRALNTAGRILPWSVRKRLAEILFYAK